MWYHTVCFPEYGGLLAAVAVTADDTLADGVYLQQHACTICRTAME